MHEIVNIIQDIVSEVSITFEPKQLPFPAGFDDSQLRQHMDRVYETKLSEGIEATIDHFEVCLKDGRLSVPIQ
jgi:hypothetical protein